MDDVGALATLHALEDAGRANTLGVIAGTTGGSVVPAVDVINTHYGRGELPIGLLPRTFTPDRDDYAPKLASPRLFISDQTNATAPSSTDLYRSLLASAAGPVKIVIVGGQSAAHLLMDSGANHNNDGIALTGMQLIQQKVSELVIMGGHFGNPNYAEYNIKLDIP
ncbi:MAG: hypothetical protein HC888_11045, partial [Candidatus Competibacteraceae bacterium]|nr:hypothetical protein [Candidatus Competibacteraceae bacterium]